MKLLLDTSALLWWLADDPRFGDPIRDIVADPVNDVMVSIVSLWEILVKVRIGKLEADLDEILAAMDEAGFTLVPIEIAHLAALRRLPLHHRAPFDHLLIAQAIGEEAVFVSADRRVPAYPVRHVACSAPGSPFGS